MEQERKELDVDAAISYLSIAFSNAVRKAIPIIGNKALRFKNKTGRWETTELYDFQVDFCHLTNDIKNEPIYSARKNIRMANELIEQVVQIAQ